MVNVSFNIPDAKVNELFTGFIRAYPKPEGSSISNMDHYINFIKDMTLRYYRTGKRLIAEENLDAGIDEDVLG
jgi:hypothetical protein